MGSRPLTDADRPAWGPLHALGSSLRGRRGPGAAATLWLTLGVLLWVAVPVGGWVLGGSLLALLLTAASLVLTGRGAAGLRWALVLSALAGLLSAQYVWWVLGVMVEAADTFSAPPALATHAHPAMGLLAVSVVVFAVGAVLRVRRQWKQAPMPSARTDWR